MKNSDVFLAGEFVPTDQTLSVVSPFSGEEVYTVGLASAKHIESAIDAGLRSMDELRKMPVYKRYEILMSIASGIEQRQDKIAETISLESGKPFKYSMGEVKRAIQTFTIAAEEAKRPPSEYLQLDWTEPGKGKEGVVKYFPIGLIAGICPFNFPLNLVAHKVAPAIASGCPIIIKPASATPVTALILAEIVAGTALPKGAFSVLPSTRNAGDMLVTDERIKLLTFTGSPDVGWDMKARAGKKKVVLELGGNAGVLIDGSADLKKAVQRCLVGGFAYSGQVCIHAQRIFVTKDVYADFERAFLSAVAGLKKGDPLAPDTDIAEMIDAENAERVEAWISEATDAGAKILTGGTRSDSYVEPTVITNTTTEMKANSEEIFGPVVVLESVDDFHAGIRQLNNTRFGLQAGVFTNSMSNARYAFDNLEVGGVIMNDVPTFRVDHMPYGGVKDSGLGREGVKYAMRDMLEPRIMVW